MGVCTKAVLLGTHRVDEVAAVLGLSHLGQAFVSTDQDTSLKGYGPSQMGIVRIEREPENRFMYVFTGCTSDHDDVYAGEKTITHLGAGDFAVEAMEYLASRWGGWICENDATDEWRFVAGDAGHEVEPDVAFAVEMQRLLGFGEAKVMRELFADDERLKKFEELLAERRARIDAASSPSI